MTPSDEYVVVLGDGETYLGIVDSYPTRIVKPPREATEEDIGTYFIHDMSHDAVARYGYDEAHPCPFKAEDWEVTELTTFDPFLDLERALDRYLSLYITDASARATEVDGLLDDVIRVTKPYDKD